MSQNLNRFWRLGSLRPAPSLSESPLKAAADNWCDMRRHMSPFSISGGGTSSLLLRGSTGGKGGR